MTRKKFDEFVDQQIASTNVAMEHRDQLFQSWCHSVRSFYDRVDRFLADYVSSGRVQLSYGIKSMHEPILGDYELEALEIKLGSQVLLLEPIGCRIVGAYGRIDLKGPYGQVRFLLLEPGISSPKGRAHIQDMKETFFVREAVGQLEWKIATKPPEIRYIELNADTFFDAVMEVASVK